MKKNENNISIKELEFYRDKFEKSFLEQKSNIDKVYAIKLEKKQRSFQNISKQSITISNSPERILLNKDRTELLIEEALSSQVKEYQKELDASESIIADLQKSIKNIEISDKSQTFNFIKEEREALLEEFEKNLQKKLIELEEINENRISKEQAFQREKFEKNLKNMKEFILKEDLPKEEKEIIQFQYENDVSMKLTAFSQEKQKACSIRKGEINEKVRNYYEKKKNELKKDLQELLRKEMDLWEEEKREKNRNFQSFFNSKENLKGECFKINIQELDNEIQKLEEIKENLESYQVQKQVFFEEIQRKQYEINEAYKHKEEIIKKINQKYSEIVKKQKNNPKSSKFLKKVIKEKSMVLESLKTKNCEEESKMYFSSNNTNNSDSSIRDQLHTGKFREKTTNTKESNVHHFKQNSDEENELIEFSSNNENNDDEVDFNISSDEKNDETY